MSKKLTEDEEARYAAMAEWAESDAGLIPEGATIIRSTGDGAGRALLEAALGSAEAVDRAIGRPTLDGTVATGKSPTRQVRLPRDLDALLTERASAEHRKPSELMREALDQYLRKAS
jgi:hypothetical protein